MRSGSTKAAVSTLLLHENTSPIPAPYDNGAFHSNYDRLADRSQGGCSLRKIFSWWSHPWQTTATSQQVRCCWRL